MKIFKKKIISLFHCDRRLHYTKINENRFLERAGTWWRGQTSPGGRWEPPSCPLDPRRALEYKDVDVNMSIFAKIREKQ